MASIPRKSELERWLGEHDKTQSVSLREWIFACQERTGHNLFIQMFVYDNLGGDTGTLKTNLRPATHEVARHKGILGDWSVTITDQLLEATIIFTDGMLAKIIMLKIGVETMSQAISLPKEKVVEMIKMQGDSIVDLLAWTRKQPTSRLAWVSPYKGATWQKLMAFRDERLANLPQVVSKASIQYLLKYEDKKYWMFYIIILWLMENNGSIHDPEAKEWVLTRFKQIQKLRKPAVTK